MSQAASLDSVQKLLLDIAQRLQETQRLLQAALLTSSEPVTQDSKRSGTLPTIDATTLTVRSTGRSCFLGNTLPFWLLSRLLRRPNCYVSHATLMDEVWKGVRSSAAIRSVVRELRSKLRDAGMDEIADGIDGTVRGHYAYIERTK